MENEASNTKAVEYYSNLPYPVQLSEQTEDGEKYWLAEILDLPGCMADGSTPGEAISDLQEAKRLWMQAEIENGHEIPEPSQTRGFSGKILLRLPKSLHRRMSAEAQRDNVSLNQLIVNRLIGGGDSVETMRRLVEQVEQLSKEVACLRSSQQWPSAQTLMGALHDTQTDPSDLWVVLTAANAESGQVGTSFTRKDPVSRSTIRVVDVEPSESRI